MSKTAKKSARYAQGSIDQILGGAMNLQNKGLLKEAENIYRKLLDKFPGHPGTLRLMAVLAHQNGSNSGVAIDLLRQAIAGDPDFAAAHQNLAFLLSQEGQTGEAIFHFSEAARLNPDDIESLLEQARLLDEEAEHDEALEIYDRIIEINPNDQRAYRGRGKILATRGPQWKEEAAKAMRKAAEIAPDDHITVLHKATILAQLGYTDEAVETYDRALELEPDEPETLFAFANLLRDRKETQRAVDLFSRAIELKPDYAAAYVNLGNLLAEEALLEEAIACARQAVALRPDIFEAYNNLGSALQTACRPAEALECYEKALTLRTDDDKMLWNLALCLLAVGRIEDGWDLYGFGFASGERRPFRPFPGLIWQGEDLAGKTIMITREQGLGDDLRFSTCFGEIVAEAGHVIIETNERLVPLYQRTWPQATVRPESGRSTGLLTYGPVEVDFDYTAPAGIVASMRRRSLAAFPRVAKPLVADPEQRLKARAWLDTLGAGPKIGLTWRSGLRNPVRDIVATAPADWARFLNAEGAKLINLQFGEPDEEIREAAEKHGLTIHQMPGLDTHSDLDGTAALTAELDFVTGLWNAATEMAGALGVPGVIYMPAHHSMQLGTGILPWHPSMRTYSVMPGFDRRGLIESIENDVRERLTLRP
ncbi:MAG: tetratricopeptide repeat protein [Parvibaculum sp.]|uniref:tetratricopeptide repeat protein n=1 Tax=Parvibaculum sp. TaxID=2024848 RepID=UPI0025F057F7|nr:tetratricopeptide repeat protein [Parvibaculum sp.]MCE9650699.1 tetratricopeptide repeat protein [Parvibaculum sp.]